MACKPFVEDKHGELLAISLLGRDFGVRPSRILKVSDEATALDFDMTCTTRLLLYDAEREKRQLEALSMGTMSKALGTSKVTVDRSNIRAPLNA
jgi:hypothetical protein